MNVLITGATGWVGTTLAEKLISEGHSICGVTRDKNRINIESNLIKNWLQWNEFDQNKTTDFFPKIDSVIHLAGESIAGKRWTEITKKRLRDSRLTTTRTIASFVKKNKIPVFISASAIGYYGDQGDAVLNENSKKGEGFLSDLCADWEKIVFKDQDQARCVVLRIGLVLGKNGGALKKMILPYKLGLGGPLAGGQQWISWIHLTDLCDLIVNALSNVKMKGIYNAVSPEPIQQYQFSALLAEHLSRPNLVPVPKAALKLLLGEMSTVLTDSNKVYPSKLQDLGFKFKYKNLEAAIKNILN